ncbi:hypothetical protein AX15_005750 [Amanita polypyramis BW_CC]|nr:hypothetical protein AX15_005750 [Amanita polypyramis BW_CC]
MNRNTQNTQQSHSASADGLPQPGPSSAVSIPEDDALLAQLEAITGLPQLSVGGNLFYAPDLLTESYTQQHLSSSSVATPGPPYTGSAQSYIPSFPAGLPWPPPHQDPYGNLPPPGSSPVPASPPNDTSLPAGLNYAYMGTNSLAVPSSGTSASADTFSDTEHAAVDDKRRRNTVASARFRIKKKLKTINLERSVSDLKGRAEELEREVADLRRENGWLKEIVMLKGTHLAALNLTQQLQALNPRPDTERQRLRADRSNRVVSSEVEEEQRDDSEDGGGKGKKRVQ